MYAFSIGFHFRLRLEDFGPFSMTLFWRWGKSLRIASLEAVCLSMSPFPFISILFDLVSTDFPPCFGGIIQMASWFIIPLSYLPINSSFSSLAGCPSFTLHHLSPLHDFLLLLTVSPTQSCSPCQLIIIINTHKFLAIAKKQKTPDRSAIFYVLALFSSL